MIEEIESSKEERLGAKAAHELFAVNMVIVNIFTSLGLVKLLSLEMKTSVMITIFVSVLIMIYTYRKTIIYRENNNFLQYYHWDLAMRRNRVVIGGYIYYLTVGMISGIITMNEPVMMGGTSVIGGVMEMAGIVPLFLIILVMTIVGSGSIFNASKGEITSN